MTARQLPQLAGKYAMVNIKLDKTGGLTEALKLRAEAEKAGFSVMVGCMVGTSLAMRRRCWWLKALRSSISTGRF